MAAPIARRLSRRLTAGAATGELVSELYADGKPATDLAGATATAIIRRADTLPDDPELPVVPVVLDAEAATATLALSGAETTMLAPSSGKPFNLISVLVKVVKVVTTTDLLHRVEFYHADSDLELWGPR